MTVTSATTCWGDSLYNLTVTMAEQYGSVCVCVCVCVCVSEVRGQIGNWEMMN